MVLLIGSTVIIAAIAGFVSLGDGEWFCGVAGQVAHGLLSMLCFALVGGAFWRFGWKVGVIDLALVLIASNTTLTLCRRLRRARVFEIRSWGRRIKRHEHGGDFKEE